jgi:hypothetical protein
MFKSIIADGDIILWKIIDDDFEETVPIAAPTFSKINAIISTYKSKNLNVAANLLLYFKSNSSVNNFDINLKNFLHFRDNYIAFDGDLEKYLSLL